MVCGFLLFFALTGSINSYKITSVRLDKSPISVNKVDVYPFINDIREAFNENLHEIGEGVAIPKLQLNLQQSGIVVTKDVQAGNILCSVPLSDCITIDSVEEIIFGKSVDLNDNDRLVELIQSFKGDIYKQSYLIAKKVLEFLSVKLQDCNELAINISENELKLFTLAYGLAILSFTGQLNNPEINDYIKAKKNHLPLYLDSKTLNLCQDNILINKVLRNRRCLDELFAIPFGVDEFLRRIDQELSLSIYRPSDAFSSGGPILQDIKTSAQQVISDLLKLDYAYAPDDRQALEFKELLYSIYSTVCSFNIWPGFKSSTDPAISDGAVGISAINDSKAPISAPCLVPIIGFCNHSINSNAQVTIVALDNGLFYVNLVAKTNIISGEQVLINYGDFGNYLFYLNYGFIPPSNPSNRVYVEADGETILNAATNIGYGSQLPTCYPRGLPKEKLEMMYQLNIFERVQEIEWETLYKNPYYAGVPLLRYQEHMSKFAQADPLQYYMNPHPKMHTATHIENTEHLNFQFKPKANRFIWINLDGSVDPRLLLALKISFCRNKSQLSNVKNAEYQDLIANKVAAEFLKFSITDRFYKTHLQDVQHITQCNDDFNKIMALFYALSIKLQILGAIKKFIS